MSNRFMDEFLHRTHFPQPAITFLQALTDCLSEELSSLVRDFRVAYDYRALTPSVESLATRSGYSAYSIWLAVLILAAEDALPRYRCEQDFWNTFEDLRYKAQECFDLHGVWGTFVPVWYPRFYEGTIIKLGRMQYDTQPWYGTEPIAFGNTVIHPGDTCLHLHIPASGEPFDRETRLASYRAAVEYFERPLLCVCNSWLLFPPYETVFSPASNIADFRREFHLIKTETLPTFTLWNIIGPTYKQPPAAWPETTSLQRSFKAYAQNGGAFGTAIGVLSFDGCTVQTRT